MPNVKKRQAAHKPVVQAGQAPPMHLQPEIRMGLRMPVPRKHLLNRLLTPKEAMDKHKKATDLSLETNKPTPYPKIKDYEEDISRYGQMALWLDRMAGQAKIDKGLQKKLKALSVLAIREFSKTVDDKMAVVAMALEETEEDAETSLKAENGKRAMNWAVDIMIAEGWA